MATLTVLGCSPGWAQAGIASSGYVLEHQGHTLLLDAGHGVAAVWRSHFDRSPDVIAISHAHADHSSDLPAFKLGTKYGPLPYDGPGQPKLVATPETLRVLEGVEALRVGDNDFYTSTYDFLPVPEEDSSKPVQAGPFSIRALHVPHLIPTWAFRIDVDGKMLGYSADTGAPPAEFIDFFRAADLLVIEAGLPESYAADDNLTRIHLTPTMAVDLAKQIGAGKTLVTHLSDKSYRAEVAAASATVWPDGDVEVARPEKSYTL